MTMIAVHGRWPTTPAVRLRAAVWGVALWVGCSGKGGLHEGRDASLGSSGGTTGFGGTIASSSSVGGSDGSVTGGSDGLDRADALAGSGTGGASPRDGAVATGGMGAGGVAGQGGTPAADGNGGPACNFTEFPLPRTLAQPTEITSGPDGNLWFIEPTIASLGRITPTGQITELVIPSSDSALPEDIAINPNNNL